MKIWKCSFIFLSILLFINFLFPKKIGILENVLKPRMIRTSSSTIYVSEQYHICCFDLKDLSFRMKLGGKGEGPGQFWVKPNIKVYKKELIAFFPFRVTHFSFSGEIIKERKLGEITFDIGFVNGHYICSYSKLAQENGKYDLSNFTLYDHDFNKIKTLISTKSSVVSSNGTRKKHFLIKPIIMFQCYNGKIYISKGIADKIEIEVYDSNGGLLKTIQREYKKIKISEESKKKRLQKFRSIPAIKKRWHRLIKLFDYTFPEYYPPMEDFRVRNEKIYVKTYNYQNQEVEFLILDLDGTLISKTFLPDIKSAFYDIIDNKYYYIKENEDTEDWELFKLEFEK